MHNKICMLCGISYKTNDKLIRYCSINCRDKAKYLMDNKLTTIDKLASKNKDYIF